MRLSFKKVKIVFKEMMIQEILLELSFKPVEVKLKIISCSFIE
jgi:hypothetical protein